jgi:transcriptional regulator with XRE-family HTH domain
MSTQLSDYLEKMRQRRDPPLSMSLMSTEAGLSPSAVRQIIKGDIKKPNSDTLRKLADRWGTDEDYHQLMKLAGHRLPEEMSAVVKSVLVALDITDEEEQIKYYNEMQESKERAQEIIAMLAHRAFGPPKLSPGDKVAQSILVSLGDLNFEQLTKALGFIQSLRTSQEGNQETPDALEPSPE